MFKKNSVPTGEYPRKKWIEAMSVHQAVSLEEISNGFQICIHHFTENDINRGKRNRLKLLAVPTVFPRM